MPDRRFRPTGMALTAAVLAAVLPLSESAAADRPALPGVTADDPRAAVDPRQAPWTSLAKVQTNLAGSCTGVRVAPRQVLTAAHCLYNRRTRAMLPASSLHVLFGYDRGDYSLHRGVGSYRVDPGYDGQRPGASVAHDWAVLTLDGDGPADAPVLPLAARPPEPGTAVVMAGYNQDRRHVLMADRDCRIRRTAAVPQPVLLHDCVGTFGTSGAPLLRAVGAGWEIVGVTVAALPDGTLRIAVGTGAAGAALNEMAGN